ncbi:MAG: hypothetical protein CMI63_11175 [Parvularcula sp.]|nr:hypothetical protein [Parvularcula sp.]
MFAAFHRYPKILTYLASKRVVGPVWIDFQKRIDVPQACLFKRFKKFSKCIKLHSEMMTERLSDEHFFVSVIFQTFGVYFL